jgi:hypothetical protein
MARYIAKKNNLISYLLTKQNTKVKKI